MFGRKVVTLNELLSFSRMWRDCLQWCTVSHSLFLGTEKMAEQKVCHRENTRQTESFWEDYQMLTSSGSRGPSPWSTFNDTAHFASASARPMPPGWKHREAPRRWLGAYHVLSVLSCCWHLDRMTNWWETDILGAVLPTPPPSCINQDRASPPFFLIMSFIV